MGKYQSRNNVSKQPGSGTNNNKDLENNSKPDLATMISEERKK